MKNYSKHETHNIEMAIFRQAQKANFPGIVFTGAGHDMTADEVAELTGYPESVVKESLAELVVHGVIEPLNARAGVVYFETTDKIGY